MALHSTVLTAWVLLLGATVPCFGEEAPKQPLAGVLCALSSAVVDSQTILLTYLQP